MASNSELEKCPKCGKEFNANAHRAYAMHYCGRRVITKRPAETSLHPPPPANTPLANAPAGEPPTAPYSADMAFIRWATLSGLGGSALQGLFNLIGDKDFKWEEVSFFQLGNRLYICMHAFSPDSTADDCYNRLGAA